MNEFKISESERRVERKKLRKNLTIVSIIVSAAIALLFWGFYGMHRNDVLLSKYGKEVTAIYVEVCENRNVTSDPMSGHFGEVTGYSLWYYYEDSETGYQYHDRGAYYKNKDEAISHVGEQVQIIIYRNLSSTKEKLGTGIGQYGTVWLSLAITLSMMTVTSIILVIVFRKKIFLSKKDRMAKFSLPE